MVVFSMEPGSSSLSAFLFSPVLLICLFFFNSSYDSYYPSLELNSYLSLSSGRWLVPVKIERAGEWVSVCSWPGCYLAGTAPPHLHLHHSTPIPKPPDRSPGPASQNIGHTAPLRITYSVTSCYRSDVSHLLTTSFEYEVGPKVG